MTRPVEILYVEDNEGDRKLMESFLCLDRSRCRLSFACDGVEALEYLNRRGRFSEAAPPDLIILDLNLPRKNGKDVLQEIKGDEKLKATPVVILSSSRHRKDVEACYELQASCYIPKPQDLDDLDTTLHRIEEFWVKTIIYRDSSGD